MASVQAVATMLAMFHELYPTRDVDEKTAVAWEWALEKITDERMMWAAKQLVTENSGRTFFPTPNELTAYLSNAVEHSQPYRRLSDGSDTVNDAVDEWYAKGGARQLWEENAKINAEFAAKYPSVWGNKP